MLIAVIVLWIICGYLCCKIDSILTAQPTWSVNLIIAVIFWPIVFLFILFQKHYVGGRRIEGQYPDNWRH